ncbi:Lipoate-protein ligase LplJ [anaerobic digester metagenome]
MKLVNSNSTNVYHNLAVEEFFLDNMCNEDYLILWTNDVSVVVGKYQNVFEEVNCKEIQKNSINLVRRNSGGGTVFHDLGNLNYTFITDYRSDTFAGYDEFINPVISFLNSLGVEATKRNACDIVIGDEKISGNAQTIRKNRVLHHGTLLFDSNLNMLQKTLKPVVGEFESRAIKSVRSSVTNIKDHLDDKTIDFQSFKELFISNLFEENIREYTLSKTELAQIHEIEKNKYKSWEWNFGFSSNFTYKKKNCFNGVDFDLELVVKKGVIKECKLKNGSSLIEEIESLLCGHRYDYYVIKAIFETEKRFEQYMEIIF